MALKRRKPKPSVQASRTVDSEVFKSAMRVLAAGVVMVTTRIEGRPWGLTISACCSLSVDPPQVLVSLGRHTKSREAIIASGQLGVSILRAGQKQLAQLAAQAGAPKWIDGFIEGSGPDDGFLEGGGPPGLRSPMIAGALCHLDCAVETAFELVDHTLVIAIVERVAHGEPAGDGNSGPLLYFDRTFRSLGEAVE